MKKKLFKTSLLTTFFTAFIILFFLEKDALSAPTTEDTIQRSYIAYYARPADPAGMDFWKQRLNSNNGDIQGIIDDFGNSTEYVDRFSSLSNTQLVNNLFRNLFNRDADSAGLNFYVNLLSTGQSSLARIALDVINGSRNDDLIIVNNKLDVSHYYTEAVRAGSLSYDLEKAVSIVATVNTDSSSANLAKAEIDASGNGGGSGGNTTASINRGGEFFGTVERFNRYYTDSSYSPNRRLYVSPNGNGGGMASDPMSVDNAFAQLTAGTEIRFLAGEYNGCWGVDEDTSGTYNDPVVIKADPGVTVNCCNTGRRSCFNLEFADHVAIDGFHLNGGDYGVRSVGGYATSEHQEGVAILNNHGENQNKDPFFTGGSDWVVVEDNIANDAGEGDGHGIYLSNGGDWMIVRGNELYNNASSDLQINADPISTCEEEGIPYNDPRCDGSATNGLGQGVSEFILVENNYLHNSAVGPNFTSVRNSVIRNNIIGFYERHNTSFWQETDNPNLGSSNNTIEHNLFIGENNRHVLQLINSSTNNTVRNNVLLGVSLNGASASVNNNTVLIEQDGTTQGTNTFAGNYLVGGTFENFTPGSANQQDSSFNLNWFDNFPTNRMGSIAGFQPTANAPFLDVGDLQSSSATDISGTSRSNPVDLGPWHTDVTGAADPDPTPPVTPTPTVGSQFVTYTLSGRTWLADAQSSGAIVDVTARLDTLASGSDRWINISPDGEWLLLESERFDAECDGWACLIYGKRDFSEFRVVKLAVPTDEGSVVHTEGFSAISNDGNLIVAHISDNGRNDLMVTRRTGTTWSALTSITANSPSNMNLYPAISADGQEVLFHCGENVCIVNTDGSSLQTLIRLSDNPSGSWEEVRSADFDASSGDIIFEADDGSERIWRYNRISRTASLINAAHTNDNSSCVLPDGQIASLWLNRPGNANGVHELKVMSANGASHFLIVENQDVGDFGIGCGGR